MYKEVKHTADLSILVKSKDKKELFIEAAEGMFSLIYDNYKDKKNNLNINRKIEIKMKSFDYETLLVDFLSELLYINEKEGFVLLELNINLKDYEISGEIFGDIEKKSDKKIKAVTYNELNIKKRKSFYETKIVFDV